MDEDADPTPVSQQIEDDVHDLFDHAPCGFLSTLPDGTIIKVNATFLQWTGYSQDFLLNGKRFQDLLPVAGKIFHDTHFGPLLLMQDFAKELAFEILCADGGRLPVLLNSTLKRAPAGEPQVIRTTLLDARGRRAYEEELRLAKRKAEAAETEVKRLNESLEERVAQQTAERDRIWRMSLDMLVVANVDGRIVSFNPAFTRITGWTEEELESTSFFELAHPDHLPTLHSMLATLSAGEPVSRLEMPSRHKDGSYRWLSWTVMPEGDLLYAVGRDISDEKLQAEVLSRTEDALRQAQKMQAIGKLTGGVAHDFNNILQVISSNLELLQYEFGENPVINSRLTSAITSVDRGASLSSQLLAFARKQPLKPVATDLGRLLHGMNDLFKHALGEMIDVKTAVSGDLWTVLIDPNQLENVVLNLAINARDAMNGAGQLTLEAGNVFLDARHAGENPDLIPGEYVMLAVSDTGSGMPKDVMERVFEPFFTTKPEGEGTGLGLSMVYGFVRQSGGHIELSSEPGRGTTFKIYLPRVHLEKVAAADPRDTPVHGGNETMLVVEDDPAVLAAGADTLTALGYRVVEARDGKEALRLLESGLAIDLLFADVVMPGPIRSPDLARRSRELLPKIKVLFTSGYTQDAMTHDGCLDPDVELISKPYRRDELARKIRQVLDA